MSIRELRKYKAKKLKRKLTNHEKDIVIRELLKCSKNNYSTYHFNILCADILDLFITDIDNIEPNTYIVNISDHTIYLTRDMIKKINKDFSYLTYLRSYTFDSGECYSVQSLRKGKSTFNYAFKAYEYKDNYPHGGCCTIEKHDIFRRLLDCEILKLPKEPVHKSLCMTKEE